MKKIVLILTLVAIMVFAFTACNNNDGDNIVTVAVQDTNLTTDSTQIYEPTETTPAAETNLGQPTDTQLEMIYHRAVEAYSWFRMASMPADSEDTATDEDGNIYFRVVVDGINSLIDLETHLRTIFATDIVDDLMDFRHPPAMYRDFDGVLFTVGGERGADITRGGESHEIIRTTREHHGYDLIVYRVIVDILDVDNLQEVVGFEIYDFSLSLVDGNWIFLNFNLTR